MGDFAVLTSSLKTAFDLAKSAKDVNDETRVNVAIAGVMEQLMNVQAELASTQVEYQALFEEVKRLRAELDNETRFDDYRLERTPMGGFIFSLRDKHVTEDRPPHSICPCCKEDGRLSVLSDSEYRYDCPSCQFVAGKKPRPPRYRRRTVHPGFT